MSIDRVIPSKILVLLRQSEAENLTDSLVPAMNWTLDEGGGGVECFGPVCTIPSAIQPLSVTFRFISSTGTHKIALPESMLSANPGVYLLRACPLPEQEHTTTGTADANRPLHWSALMEALLDSGPSPVVLVVEMLDRVSILLFISLNRFCYLDIFPFFGYSHF